MNTTPEQAPNSSFKTRLKSAAILAPAVLLIIYFGGGAFAIMMALAAGIAVFEWARMVMTGQTVNQKLFYLSAVLAGMGVMTASMVGSPVVSLWFLFALCFLIFAYNKATDGPSVKALLIGLVYIGFSISMMVWIRQGTSGQGLYDLLTLLFIVWASDIFAYLTGRSLGGPKLAPMISPKKTWSGFFGSSVGAGAVAALMATAFVAEKFGIKTIGGMGPVGYFIMAFVLAMFGQAGDLWVSLFKRHYGVKDTGTLIPGHGGILDRIDALMLVAIIFGGIMAAAG